MAAQPGVAGQLGRYRILEELGSGGMGTVFLAEDMQLDRKVALKVPKFGDKDSIEEFLREARVAAGIDHPYICRVIDVGQIDDVYFLTMPFIEGKTLANLIHPDRPWEPVAAVKIIRKAAQGVAHLHENRIIHRDLKPGNIMIRFDSGDPVLMDFGLARSIATKVNRLTKEGGLKGTPAYMAPEQILTPMEVGIPADVYSLGMILYEMIVGKVPFEGNLNAVLGQVLHLPAPPPSRFREELPTRLDILCLRTLEKIPALRYRNVGEFIAALDEFLYEAARFPAPPLPPPAPVPGSVGDSAVKPPSTREPEPLPRTWVTQLPSEPPVALAESEPPRPEPEPKPKTVSDSKPTTDVNLVAPVAPPSSPEPPAVSEAPPTPRTIGESAAAAVPIVRESIVPPPVEEPPPEPLVDREPEPESESEPPEDDEIDEPRRNSRRRTLIPAWLPLSLTAVVAGLVVWFVVFPPKLRPPERKPPGELSIRFGNPLVVPQGGSVSLPVTLTRTNCPDDVAFGLDGASDLVVEEGTIEGAKLAGIIRLRADRGAAVGRRTLTLKADSSGTTASEALQVVVVPAADARKFENSLGMTLMLIPQGKGLLGADEEPETNERPIHEFAQDSLLFMGETEVTVDQFRKFVDATRYETSAEKKRRLDPKQRTWTEPGTTMSGTHPVVCIGWNDAWAFCEWLTEREGLAYDLPFEAEWEYACRAGTRTAFHFGRTSEGNLAAWDNRLSYPAEKVGGAALNGPMPVKSFAANDWGLFDMHGNAREWCRDGGRRYAESARTNHRGQEGWENRACRGGAWSVVPKYCRAARREFFAPEIVVDSKRPDLPNTLGFRIVCRGAALKEK